VPGSGRKAARASGAPGAVINHRYASIGIAFVSIAGGGREGLRRYCRITVPQYRFTVKMMTNVDCDRIDLRQSATGLTPCTFGESNEEECNP